MDRAKGIDVSHHQGVIDWQAVAAAGYTFAFIRASLVGTQSGKLLNDSRFVENWQKAKDAGILITAYHFFIPQPGSTAQVDHFLNAFGSRAPNFPLALDFEKSGGFTKEQVTPCILDAIQVIETRTGRKPIIYSRANWWHRFVVSSPNWANHDLWVANYENPNGPLMPPDFGTWRFWQWSDKGTVSGIATPVDLDWYNGTEAELRQHAI